MRVEIFQMEHVILHSGIRNGIERGSVFADMIMIRSRVSPSVGGSNL